MTAAARERNFSTSRVSENPSSDFAVVCVFARKLTSSATKAEGQVRAKAPGPAKTPRRNDVKHGSDAEASAGANDIRYSYLSAIIGSTFIARLAGR